MRKTKTRQLIPFLTEGVVVANNDADEMGRVKVWIPAVDGEKYDVETLPWAEYSSPLAGVTNNYVVGRELDFRAGPVPYGFWAIPKVNAIVLVMFLNGDSNRRYYIGNVNSLHANRGLPAGRNVNPDNNDAIGPWTDTYEPLQPAYRNLRAAFQDNLTASESQTRGFYQKQAAQAKTDKDNKEGYSTNTVDTSTLDPQTYCWSTPGGHYLTMVDDPANCRIRLKTISGNQMIFDDSNERIYVSTARGGTWFELDEDGHMHGYANESISFSAGGDINFTAKKNFNVLAGTGINLKTSGPMNLDADADFNLSIGGSIYATACGGIDLLAEGKPIIAQGPQIHLNSDPATAAEGAEDTSIQPAHEPWSRPESKTKRNAHWKK